MNYYIKKGKHRCRGIHAGILFKDKIKIGAKFHPSCIYDHGDSDNYDVNKLYGFSTTWFHHQQSARIGWRCIDGKNIQILSYTYNKGKRINPELLGEVKTDQNFVCSIIYTGRSFVYTFQSFFNPMMVHEDLIDKLWFPFKYILFPYFGGNKSAPHNMSLEIEKIEI